MDYYTQKRTSVVSFIVITALVLLVVLFCRYFYELINRPVEIKVSIEEPPSIPCQCFGEGIGQPIYPAECPIQPSKEPKCTCPSIGEGVAIVPEDFCASDERLAGQDLN